MESLPELNFQLAVDSNTIIAVAHQLDRKVVLSAVMINSMLETEHRYILK